MTAPMNMKLTIKDIVSHIEANIDKWLFVGHVANCHINATTEELQARLGKYENGRLVTRSSTFIDESCGDDIIDGLTAALENRAPEILDWLYHGKRDIASMYFGEFPNGVSGISCSIYNETPVQANGYIVLLCKNEQYPFYLLNAYPVVCF